MLKISYVPLSSLFLIVFTAHLDCAQKRECSFLVEQIKDQFDPEAELIEGLQEYNLKKIQFALQLGASPNHEFKNFTPLTYLINDYVLNKVDTLSGIKLLLINGADIDKKDNKGCIPLQLSLEKENDDTMAYFLIAQGANLNSVDGGSNTPISAAMSNHHNNLMLKLLELGVDLNIKTKTSPLGIATIRKDIKTIEMLLENGADVDGEDLSGTTALIFAVIINNKDVVELLLRKGAQINKRSGKLKRTPLEQAIAQSRVYMVKLLLQHGADTSGAYDFALKHANKYIAQMIGEHIQKTIN